MANFIYLIGDPSTREAAVVDPAWDTGRILETAERDGYGIKHVLVTHAHPDHVNGVGEVLDRTGARLHVHKSEMPWVGGWESPVVPSEDRKELEMGNLTVGFIHTPGHSPGSQCFLIGRRLFSGDTLFINACGRTDLPGGDPTELYESLAKLKRLDDRVMVYPGHNYADRSSATVGDQKKQNSFLRAWSLSEFLTLTAPHPVRS